jgi:transcriptional regulator with XRE-family HTH domain
METIGNILKNAREKKGLSVQDLEATTRIVSRYITALEEENFDELPAEIYVKGFLKNISDKIGLNSADMLELYSLQKSGNLYTPVENLLRNQLKPIKVKERSKKEKAVIEPISEDELLEDTDNLDKEDALLDENIDLAERFESKKKSFNMLDAVKVEREYSEEEDKKAIKETRKSHTNDTLYSAEQALLIMSRQDLPKLRLSRSIITLPRILLVLLFIFLVSGLVVYLNRDKLNIELPSIGSADGEESSDFDTSVRRNIVDTMAKQNVKSGDIVYFKPLGISATITFINIGNIVKVDVNGDEMSFSKSSPIMADLNGNGINDFKISLIEIYEDLATVQIEKLQEITTNNNLNDSDLAIANNITNTLDDASVLMLDGDMYLLRNTEKTSIAVEITAKGFVYVRYFIDSERPATTNLLSGKSLSLSANDVMMLTIGDASEVAVWVNGKLVTLGKPGETINKTIKWVRDLNDSTRFSLVISDTK